MADVQIFNTVQFQQASGGKKIICFGGGTYLRLFLNDFPEIPVECVIDNYLCKKQKSLSIGSMEIPVITMEECCRRFHRETLIVVTSIHYLDMLRQLDEKKEMERAVVTVYPLFREADADQAETTEKFLKLWEESRVLEETGKRGNGLDKCQIWEILPDDRTAGGKAPRDIRDILREEGFQAMKAHIIDESDERLLPWEKERADQDWNLIFERISENAVVVLQHPFRTPHETRDRVLKKLKKEKHVRYISLVHDIETVRSIHQSPHFKREFLFMLQIADVMIVHNEWMKKYMEERSYPKERMIVLEIFDYLTNCSNRKERVSFERSVCYAGSLERVKSPFLYQMGKLNPLPVSLYGPYFESWENDNLGQNVKYYGSVDADRLPEVLDKGFGLIWDGNTLESCSGGTGDYLKYINPHKMSLYLASGLPVLIWEDAAGASFVSEHQVGLIIPSLLELPELLKNVAETDYMKMRRNAQEIGVRLRSGFYTRRAIQKALLILDQK